MTRMTRMKRVKTTVGLLTGAAAAVVLAAGPANAISIWMSTSDNAGSGYFQNYDDTIGVSDTEADGMSTVTRWETDYGRSGTCVDSNGADNGYKVCDYDFDEDGYGRIKVCLRDYSNDIGWINCSTWSDWHPVRGHVR
ncbi:hypothetical protein [Streptomyces sp. NPDC001658]